MDRRPYAGILVADCSCLAMALTRVQALTLATGKRARARSTPRMRSGRDDATNGWWHDRLAEWLRRWDRQQTRYLPFREERFNAMFDALEALLPPDFVALDLGCGPGSLSQRLLERFPKARAIAVDQDPLLLAMGQGALGDVGGRLRWIDANLRESSWRERIGVESVDVALSTTALHWLPPAQLVRLYTELGTLIRPDGLFLNGDHMAYAPGMEPFTRVRELVSQREERAAEQHGAESWRGWWDAITARSSDGRTRRRA